MGVLIFGVFMDFEKFNSLGCRAKHDHIKSEFIANQHSFSRRRLVRGIGVNNSKYLVRPKIGNNKVIDPCYSAWSDMMMRCYDKKYHAKQPTYSSCTIVRDWLLFSSFAEWWEENQVDGWQIDKDILVYNNTIYSPDLCVFVPAVVNLFIGDNAASRGEWPIGVSWDSERGKFKSMCNNPITDKYEFLGRFNNPELAHDKWRRRKLELIPLLCGNFPKMDSRVEAALINRYAKNG